MLISIPEDAEELICVYWRKGTSTFIDKCNSQYWRRNLVDDIIDKTIRGRGLDEKPMEGLTSTPRHNNDLARDLIWHLLEKE